VTGRRLYNGGSDVSGCKNGIRVGERIGGGREPVESGCKRELGEEVRSEARGAVALS